MQLGHVAQADARWRIYAFAGKADSSDAGSAIHRLADWLQTSADSPIVRHTRKNEDIDAVIDFRAIFQQTFEQLAYENMPSLLKPKTGRLGLQDHEKVFCVDHKGAGDIFDLRGINRDRGCLLLVRPDQYVAHVLPLDGFGELSAFFAGVLR
jgi:phenol 2-monooxygenase